MRNQLIVTVSGLGLNQKLDHLITVIADTSEYPDWIAIYDDLLSEQMSKSEGDIESLTPLNVLLCPPDSHSGGGLVRL